ncbi:MAG: OadG family protein [Bacteroidales bacterium]|nr:OadG family protein [Bacteroidales bacterium]
MTHNLYIALICICVVFTALLVLFCVYTIIGAVSQQADLKAVGEWVPRKVRRAMRKALKGQKNADAETAAAISMALEAELGGETEVAIATALALHLGHSVHDEESGIVTIPRQTSPWSDKTLTFRRLPKR